MLSVTNHNVIYWKIQDVYNRYRLIAVNSVYAFIVNYLLFCTFHFSTKSRYFIMISQEYSWACTVQLF